MALTQENVHYTLNSGPGVTNKSNRVHVRIKEFLSGGGGGGVEARRPENSLDNVFLCPQSNFGRHIVIALSVRPSVRPCVRPSRFRVRSVSLIFFEVGIPNLVCGYILGWRSVAYHFRVTVTLALTSDLVFRIIVSGAYLLYYMK